MVRECWNGINFEGTWQLHLTVNNEAALDTVFSDRTASPEIVSHLAAEAARIEGELRSVHLNAHIAVRPLLSRHQIMLYSRARGYTGTQHTHEHSGH